MQYWFNSPRAIRFASLAGVILLAMTQRVEGQSPAVRQAFEAGATAMHKGDLETAESRFRDAVRLAPAMADAHLDLGLVLGREGKLDEGVDSIQEALRLDPDVMSGEMFLGIFLFQENHPAEARIALQKAVATRPDNSEALVWLANVELATGNASRAAAALDRAAELQPSDLNVLELRGKAHSEVARESYQRMAKIDPASWHVHRVQAQLFSTEGRHAEAITEYLAALTTAQDNPDLYEGLGDEYRATNQLDAAENAYRHEQQLAPANPVALYNLGSVEVERGEAEKGAALLEQAAERYPGSSVVQYYLGRAFALLGRNDQAVAQLRKAADADPDGEIGKRSLYELARTFHRLHREADARDAMARYSRIRLQQERSSAQQVRDWKKINSSEMPPVPNR